MDRTLQSQLMPLVRRFHFRRTLLTLFFVWLAASAVAGVCWYFNQSGKIDGATTVWPILIGTGLLTPLSFWWASRTSKTAPDVAELIERQYPELDSALITAIEQRFSQGQKPGFLQQETLRKAVAHSFENPWSSSLPTWQLVATPLLSFAALLTLIFCSAALYFHSAESLEDDAIAFENAVVADADFVVKIEPGDAEVELGSSVLILARFGAHLPPETKLIFSGHDGGETALPMTKSLDDPVFGARIPTVSESLSYRVEFQDQQSEEYEIQVFEYPRLVRADAKLLFPEYTSIQEKIVQDFRRVNAVQGTRVELTYHINKPVASARLVPIGTNEEPAYLTPSDLEPEILTGNLLMDESEKFELILVDDEGRENRTPPRFVFNVIENKPPDLKLVTARDVQASPLEELQLKATAWDDFGLQALGLSYVVAGNPEQTIALEVPAATTRKKKLPVEHLLELEELDVQPDDLVSYYFWAEDVGPEGVRRRVASDMFFAEIRHFEEIFRQGAAPPAGQQPQPGQQNDQNSQQAQQLAELQKEIINATWKIIRREKGNELSPEFSDDVQVIIESQQSAIAQVDELANKIEDEDSKSFLEGARTFMNEAISHLSESKRERESSPLKSALEREQSAYKALLKLRAREHEVVKQQQQAQPGAAGNPNSRQQDQLDQLNLEEDENRYETERTAQEQTEQQVQQQEERQVLSRLRELARRQSDLNDRIKELQTALEEAKTEEEREEIEKRLKSLREQQEQMLRDTEELLERMQQESNRQNMAEETEQLEQTRENLQRAAQSLDQNEVTRAAAEGTRAQRELEELRDEFQKRTAGQFTEEMRQLRNEAQKLEQKQNEIADQLSEQPRQPNRPDSRRSLRDEQPNLLDQLDEQKESVEQIRQKMRETIEEAETLEPLLAEELYDTYRKSEVSRPDRALESTRRSVVRGWMDDARTEEERARQGIEQLKSGIETAAESILGDETEALKSARDSLEELNRQLQGEIDEANPNRESETENENSQQNQGRQSAEESENQSPSNGDSPSQNQSPQSQSQNGRSRQDGSDQRQDEANDRQPAFDQSEEPSDQPSPNGGTSRGDNSESDEEQSRSGDPRDTDPNQIRDQIRNLGNQTENRDDGLSMNRGGGNLRMMKPISGNDFRDWSDRLRDVEEMVSDPDLRAEASRIREQARELRKEMKERHSAEPNWDLVKLKVSKPLAELQDRVVEEILRRTSDKNLVPLDRDPVPVEYRDAVRKYYESLGRGE